jgi:hypothetical protein
LTRFQRNPKDVVLVSVTARLLGGGGAVLSPLLEPSTPVKALSAAVPLPPEGATARSSVGSAAAWSIASRHVRSSSERLFPISTSSTIVALLPVSFCKLAGDGRFFSLTTTRSTRGEEASFRALASEAARRVHSAPGCRRLALAHAA